MIFTTTETLAYYTSLVRTGRCDEFLAAMFLPASMREAVIAIYALDIELEHIHHVVTEEMMGHIRYAWWQENIEGLHNEIVHDHPVLQAIANINIQHESLLAIVVAYREVFPDRPPAIDAIMKNVIDSYVSGNKKWKKASNIISNHRRKYGEKRYNWLLIKLLFV
jgi:hypothetical protein